MTKQANLIMNVFSVRDTLEKALETLERYRGQVDQYGQHSSANANAALKEAISGMDTFKQQGEPAGYVSLESLRFLSDGEDTESTIFQTPFDDNIVPLYTSAPTKPCEVSPIPEGWQLCNKQDLHDLIVTYVPDNDYEKAQAMLSARHAEYERTLETIRADMMRKGESQE